MRHFLAFGAIAGLLALPACGAAEEATDESDITGGGSYVGAQVERRLDAMYGDQRGKTWNVSSDNAFGKDWVQQVPVAATWGKSTLDSPPECKDGAPACDPDFGLRVCTSDAQCGTAGRCRALASTVAHEGAAPKQLCIGHSDETLDTIYETMLSAKSYLDVSSLTPPDGRYAAAVRNAVTRLSERAAPPTVRMLYGDFPGEFFSAARTEATLTRDVAKGSKLHLTVGGYRAAFTSWNHSKIVAADGRIALVGGTNMWTDHYLQGNPVHDISLRLAGTAASDAQVFLNQLWAYACKEGSVTALQPGESCLPAFPGRSASASTEGGSKVFAVGRMGKIGKNPGDEALLAVIDAAKTSLRIAQQDLGPIKRAGIAFGDWPEPVLAALLRAAARGVRIDFALSNYGSVGGTPNMFTALSATYSNGWTLEDVHQTLVDYGKAHPETLGGKDAAQVLCQNLHLVNLRSSDAAAWPNGKALALHSKLVVADDRAFYLGSENLYRADLAEFGYVVDDARITQEFVRTYFEPLNRYSQKAPANVPQCRRMSSGTVTP